MSLPDSHCDGCKHAINPQGYFHACDSPDRLETFRRFYYVSRHPDETCRVPKVKAKATVLDNVSRH